MVDLPPQSAAPRRVLGWPETRDVLAVLSTLLFAASYAAPWCWAIPKGTEQYIGQAQGALILQWGAIMSWYFGSSKASAAVRAQLGQVIDKLPDAGGQS